ncbi:hypothetical protein [Sphingomonas sp. CROZ-RG-20F-R02-07]|uniref:hypothetical protein n=1 Tax=Sphingomonas sp. CROZ-RG-20F-R02-07 TaxID=2914832 RepID=UPI001F5784FE|nr:hypothetical protein [Sphingomonas sp. CROZ-RG-20F-R02-07]
MATLPTDSLHQEALADFVLIRTADVRQGDRLRPIDPVWAEALGRLMLRDGQDTAIQVCRLPGRSDWELVTGGHRHAGAISAGIEFMRAEIVSANRDERRLREIRENLWRSGLTPIDRAAFIAESVAIHKRRVGIDPSKDGRAASAAARWQKAVKEEAADTTATIAVVYGFTDAVAAEVGFSARTVENDLMLYRRLQPSLVERLRKARHPVFGNATQLRALAKLDEHAQAKVVDLLLVPGASLNYDQPTTVGDAVAHPLGPKPAGPKPTPDAKNLSAFIGAWQRMSVADRKGALAHLAPHLPTGTRIVDGAEGRSKAAFPDQHAQYRDEALAAIDLMRDIVEGLLEDEIIPGERDGDLRRASGQLQIARFTIAGNGFEITGEQA